MTDSPQSDTEAHVPSAGWSVPLTPATPPVVGWGSPPVATGPSGNPSLSLSGVFDQENWDKVREAQPELWYAFKTPWPKTANAPALSSTGASGGRPSTSPYDELNIGKPDDQEYISFASGLVCKIAEYSHNSAQYQNRSASFTSSIGYLSGICGNVVKTPTGAGTNNYIVFIGPSGIGKEHIGKTINTLSNHANEKFPLIAATNAGSYIASGQAVNAALHDNSTQFFVLNEIGEKHQSMFKAKSGSVEEFLKATYLEKWSKSDVGAFVGKSVFADTTKNTKQAGSQSLSIIGDTTPDVFWKLFGLSGITNGYWPRWIIEETFSNRPYRNVKADAIIPDDLRNDLHNLYGWMNATMTTPGYYVVPFSDKAKELSNDFEKWTTDEINRSSNVTRDLWNRANLKSLKLASILAVGDTFCNSTAPVDGRWSSFKPEISYENMLYAVRYIVRQTLHVVSKIDNGEVGEVAGDEDKQLTAVLSVVAEVFANPHDRYVKFGINYKMHSHNVFTETYLSRRLRNWPAFKDDVKNGPKRAIERVIKTLSDSAEIISFGPNIGKGLFNFGGKIYVVANPARFVEAYARRASIRGSE